MERPVIDQDYIQRIIAPLELGGTVTTDQYYVRYQFAGFEIAIRTDSDYKLAFWVTTKTPQVAWVPMALALPATRNAILSKSIKWVFQKLWEEHSDAEEAQQDAETAERLATDPEMQELMKKL